MKQWIKKLLQFKFFARIASAFLWMLPPELKCRARMLMGEPAREAAIAQYVPGAYPEGVNLFGYLKAQMGLGQGARLLAGAVIETGLPHTLLNVSVGNPASHNDGEYAAFLAKSPVYNTNIIHVNPEQMPYLRMAFPRSAWDRRYNIALWLWELEEFPEEWSREFQNVQEIWTPSTFTSASIARSTSLPVFTIPYGIRAETDSRFDRHYFGLPENRFIFLCMFDVNSTAERKNPFGAIDAFVAAFGSDNDCADLVVKVNNGKPQDIAKLTEYIAGRKNIRILNRTLTKTEVNSLIRACNVFVSLHRSEGFGLVMAEAMSLGVPVIGTGWSANLDFMNADNSCLVDYTLVDVNDQYYKASQGQKWAEPSVENAASHMKRLCTDTDFYSRVARSAQATIANEFSTEGCAEKIKARLKQAGLVH